MSTSATQSKLGFEAPDAELLPSISCVGTIDEVFDGKVSASESYLVQPFHIRGRGANKSSRGQLLYRPDWLVSGFKPNSLKDTEGGKGMLFVYQSHIMPRKGSSKLSTLQGLAGSEERFEELAGRILGVDVPEAATAEKASEQEAAEAIQSVLTQVSDVLRQFLLIEGEDTPIGYTMTQKKEDTGERDEKGYKIKVPTERYEIGSYYYPMPKTLAYLKGRAEKEPTRYRVAFDDSTPF